MSRVYSKDARAESWFGVTIVVERANLMTAVDRLRAIGASGVTVTPANYVFRVSSSAYEAFLAKAEGHLRNGDGAA